MSENQLFFNKMNKRFRILLAFGGEVRLNTRVWLHGVEDPICGSGQCTTNKKLSSYGTNLKIFLHGTDSEVVDI